MSVKLTDKIEYCGRSPKKRRVQSPEDLSEIMVVSTYDDLQTKIIQACDGVTATQVDISKISDNLKERIDKIEMELSKKKRRIKSIKVRF